jgi:hypothetical protein
VAIENCQQAAKFGAEFLVQGQLPDGSTASDYYDHVLDQMYRYAPKGALDFIVNDKGEREPIVRPPSDDAIKPRKDGWFFHGWMALCLFGPTAEPDLRCCLLEPGTCDFARRRRNDKCLVFMTH